ncbi:DUF2442 domain-containing protein [Oricola sp.]|uniref:DUF2442 domain-containing protein n=1 Tax=Oricola sp. TaxID=1979950 RepID=UPI0025FFB301|nr:DUF2442 domain-containing protein [Oricola sp.]MCI5073668.1 DUF2442 domain-containing protein [Oricola sp.]
MIDIVKIVEAKPIADHRIDVRFSNGDAGEADFGWLLDAQGAMVEPLADTSEFARVFLSNGVLTWPNGFDVDSINLHREMKEQGRLRRSAA